MKQVHIVVGRYLLLRASRTILEGQEVTTSYLGAQRFQHVAARRLALRQAYGFHCRCTRCVLEQRCVHDPACIFMTWNFGLL